MINSLRARDDVQPKKIALIGFSRGAVVAVNVAAEDRLIAGAVLISGVFDFEKIIAKWKAGNSPSARWLLKNFAEEAGMTEQAIEERSVSSKLKNLNVPILALHGENDAVTDPADAQRVVNVLKQRNIYAKLVVFPHWAHAIADATSEGEVTAFLDQVLHQ